jgi:DUF4097 and DUF4098 domain-containing protein YvlB
MSEQTFDTPQPVRLEIKISSGTIDVTTVDGQESSVTLDGSDKALDMARVELVGDRLIVEQRSRSSISLFGRFDGALNVRAEVPRRSKVQIVNASGDATLDGCFGGVEMSSASGSLELTGELDGDARVKNVSGDTHLPVVRGDLTVQTVSGDVTADAVAGSVSAKSVSGDVRVGSVRDGTVTVRSVSGDVELGIPTGTSVDVDAGSASGEVSSDVPLSTTPSGEPGPTVVIRSTTVSGRFHLFRAA